MAKDRNAKQRRVIKMRDNAYASTLQHKDARHPLTCTTAGCQEVALLIKPANDLGQHKRTCRTHFLTPPTPLKHKHVSKERKLLLAALGF